MLSTCKYIDPLCLQEQNILDDTQRQRCEIYTRVMGYIRPVSEFNVGKQREHKERVCFNEPLTDNNDN